MSIRSLVISSGMPSLRFFVAAPRRSACGDREDGHFEALLYWP
jgi:hypothetical protein